ncbi:hypothetical protein B0H34DRAFT_255710 [Crassisporium funariophilum]|nr:hypothetical protein B0H34DRAFT_255710 [Crassisporium funariophilum]
MCLDILPRIRLFLAITLNSKGCLGQRCQTQGQTADQSIDMCIVDRIKFLPTHCHLSFTHMSPSVSMQDYPPRRTTHRRLPLLIYDM